MTETSTDNYICPHCKHKFQADPFSDENMNYEVYCDLCGGHCAVKCPNCQHLVDGILNTEE